MCKENIQLSAIKLEDLILKLEIKYQKQRL